MRKGVITIYLSLTLTIMLSFLLTIIEGARINAIKMQTECVMDAGLYSVFAEYNRELLEQYDLFFIDTSYGGGQGNIANTREHLHRYMDMNFTQDFGVDLLKLATQQVTVTDYSLATDDRGEILKRQAVLFMKDTYGLTYLEELKGQLSTAADQSLFTRNVDAQATANQAVIDSIEIPPRRISEEEWEEIPLNNPADSVNSNRNIGILGSVKNPDKELSAAAVNLDNYLSRRNWNQGRGLGNREGLTGVDEFIFNEYLLKKCGNYCQDLEKGALSYQIEYILQGNKRDTDNLKEVVNKLLNVRQAANAVHVFSDSGKAAQAEALALTLTAVLMVPELTEPVKLSILFAWAYAESVWDVQQLLCGGKIPLMKTADTWHYSLEGMLQYQNNLGKPENGDAGEDGTGLDYQGYLRIFLALMDKDKKTERAMDIIEMDVRGTQGNVNFRLDCCMDFLEAVVYVQSKYGYECNIKRSYFYM